MKNLTLYQLANKRANAKTSRTKNKYNLFVMTNFSKNDYIHKYNHVANDIEKKNQPKYVGSDSLVR